MSSMTEFDTAICGIPCKIRITYWEPYVPAKVSGPPEDCYPSEGGYGEWEILDSHGRPAPWLESKMSLQERASMSQEVFNHMEYRYDDN
jgi:hypothetical protein